MPRTPKPKAPLAVETLNHPDASRKNIPTAEYQTMLKREDSALKSVRYPRNTDLDPQLVWRGKDAQDQADLVVPAPPIYIQEKVQPKVLIDDLKAQSAKAAAKGASQQAGFIADMFADFNGLPNTDAKTEFYQHDQHWSNRMILGDSLQVMASLAEREGLRGKVQCIYFDPPYGIKFNSNFQWSTTSRDVKDGNAAHITREPEQVKAFRDTWRDGIHSYLSYLRDRLTAARDLLTDSGSIFVQIGDENVHRVRAVMDEVFGEENFVSQIILKTTAGAGSPSGGTITLAKVHDTVLWFSKSMKDVKYRQIYFDKSEMQSSDLYRRVLLLDGSDRLASDQELSGLALTDGEALYRPDNLTSQSSPESSTFAVKYHSHSIRPSKGGWKTNQSGMQKLIRSNRIYLTKNRTIQYARKLSDFNVAPINDVWTDVGTGSFTVEKLYVVQTNAKIIQRCILMTTDPGDLVLDPTCGSGTSAYVAEQWGRRWITIDTSRVALALARARIMGARYPFYLLADSKEGQIKEAELTRRAPSSQPVQGSLRQGFVYERVPHITLKSIANNAEIDVIYERFQSQLEPLRAELNEACKKTWNDWEIPRELDAKWIDAAKTAHASWWQQRIARQREIDASIAAAADVEYLFDKPYDDKRKVRAAGPFTVESLSPHRVLAVDVDGSPIEQISDAHQRFGTVRDFAALMLENLRVAGVQQADKSGKINFSAVNPFPGVRICAEGLYSEGETPRRAGILIGPEFGSLTRSDLSEAARECAECGFDVLIACAFSFDVHTSELSKLGRIPILKARMNADLHMAQDLKSTSKANLFVIFGEPDVSLLDAPDEQMQVRVNGVDVFHPNTGEIRSDNADGIACWFIDTDYNEESFFVRHAYFLGANDPYKALKVTLKAEINEEAWASLNSDTSRPFAKPSTGRIAVKVINHLGDEVMKVFRA